MKKKLPKFKTDAEAAAFVTRPTSQYGLSGMKPVSFEFQPKAKSITMRLPETLFDAIKEEAERSYNDLYVSPLKTPCTLVKPNCRSRCLPYCAIADVTHAMYIMAQRAGYVTFEAPKCQGTLSRTLST